jgi:hypothetical protein
MPEVAAVHTEKRAVISMILAKNFLIMISPRNVEYVPPGQRVQFDSAGAPGIERELKID